MERAANCPKDLREWAWECGQQNFKQRVESGAALLSQAVTALTVVLAGIGGTLAFAVRVFEPKPDAIARAAAALCIYLMVLAALIVFTCIRSRDTPVSMNEPGNLLLDGHSLEAIQCGELARLQARIELEQALNNSRSAWLNAMRYCAAIGTPIVFGLTAWLARS